MMSMAFASDSFVNMPTEEMWQTVEVNTLATFPTTVAIYVPGTSIKAPAGSKVSCFYTLGDNKIPDPVGSYGVDANGRKVSPASPLAVSRYAVMRNYRYGVIVYPTPTKAIDYVSFVLTGKVTYLNSVVVVRYVVCISDSSYNYVLVQPVNKG